MGHPMVIQIAAGGETLSTGLTHMRLLPGVNPAMRVQTAARAKSFLAIVTHVGPLARVNSHMALQQAGPVKHLAAGVAGQHALTAVVVAVVKFVAFCRGDNSG